jgi:hypothetical protein
LLYYRIAKKQNLLKSDRKAFVFKVIVEAVLEIIGPNFVLN